MIKLTTIATILLSLMTACASTAPIKIGADTYYSAKTNTAGVFGNVSAIAGGLMADGNKFCESMGKEFELVTQANTPTQFATRLGEAAITFKCVYHANNPVMRPDNGMSTIETK